MTNTTLPSPGPLMAGKRGLIMGVANERSIAWGIARVLAGQAPSSPSPTRATPSAGAPFRSPSRSGADIIVNCDVTDLKSVDNVFAEIRKTWGGLDFVVHALAFSDRRELSGRYADTTRENFTNTMVISCFSFTEIAKRAAELMPDGGSLLTLTFGGATRWVPSYNVMGVAKAALEASVRYLAADFGAAGHPRQRAVGRADAHAGRRRHLRRAHASSTISATTRPLRRTPTLDEVGGAGALSAVGPVGRRDGRGALRRLRLQHRRHAEPRGAEGQERGARRRPLASQAAE